MKKQNNTQQTAAPVINRRTRRAIKAGRPKNRNVVVTDDKIIYKDDSYKDKSKKVFSHGLKAAKERIEAAKAKFDLPEKIKTKRQKLLTRCVVVNRDGRSREFLPDIKPQHKILVHGSVARVMVSSVCMLCRITACEDKNGNYIDGSWAVTPAEYKMINVTTIQHVRRRPFFFLRRYWYEISFDGRVQPASLFMDYQVDLEARRRSFWITREYVPVAKSDKFNDYFRFWKHKPSKK